MTDVFISYKREDEARVATLVQSLERAGLRLWWDRSLAGGESWRNNIQAALDEAKCAVVVWSQASTGPQGDFVRDEASQAKRRGILVPVSIDKVSPPLGFGEVQAIDLTGWKGKQQDPYFQDLCAAITAKLSGQPAPPAKGPARRLMRRLLYGSVGSTASACLLGLGLNAFGAQDKLCASAWLYPWASDACGAVGLGHRPTRDERVAWESRTPGSCTALEAHLQRFQSGAYQQTARNLLISKQVSKKEVWSPKSHALAMVHSAEGKPAQATKAAAQTAAIAQAQPKADGLCRSFAAAASYRLVKATPKPVEWICSKSGNGVACSFEGQAVCSLEERSFDVSESCGG